MPTTDEAPRDVESLRAERSALRRRLAEIEAALPGDDPGTFHFDEASLHALFDASYQLAGMLTPAGHVIEENSVVLDALPESAGRRGKLFWELPEWAFPESAALARAAVAEAAAGRRARFEAQLLAADGQTLTVETTVRPVRDRRGVVRALLAEGRDVTAERRAVAALAASEAQLQHVLGELEDVVCVFELDRPRIRYVSPSAQRVLGVSAEEIVAREGLFAELIPAEEEARLAAFRARCQAEGAGEIEHRVRRPDGQERLVRLRVHIVRGPDGVPLGHAILSDLTEQRRAEDALAASEELFRQLADHIPEVFWVLDPRAMRMDYVSPAYAEVFGRSGADATRWLESVHPEDRPAALAAYARLERGEEVTTEYRIVRPDGAIRELRNRALPVLGAAGELVRVVGLIFDVTEEKRASGELLASRDALAKLAGELERRVAERTNELSVANAELAHAARAKDEFLASMSHELRTPLNAVLGLSEALTESVYGPVTEAQAKALGRIFDSGRHLLALIGDILDLSKIEAGRATLDLARVSAAEVCRASLALVQEAAQRKRLTVSLQIDDGFLTVPADERRLKQILVNLLSNAVKFTPEGGAVRLNVRVDEPTEAVCFEVVDTGVGISPQDQPRLFQPFVQLDSSLTRAHVGTGLGLALVRRLVEMHGGSVTLDSRLGEGSRFAVLLPRRQASAPPPATAAAQPCALIVEDSRPVAEQLARYVREAGLVPLIHDSAHGVVERAAAERPRVIFLDILLPSEVGWQVLRDLKADPRTAHIPVVVVSVLDRPEQGAALGAAGNLVKPVSRERLAAVLAEIAGSRERPVLIVSAAAGEPRARRILLAEDDDVNTATVLDFLHSRGYEVFVARNGAEALALARELEPDLVLMDIQMPVMDGLQAIRAMRADASLATLPVVALTALAMSGDRERCLAAGANAYLTKPVGLRGLPALIERLLA